jgi:hypothetical protein
MISQQVIDEIKRRLATDSWSQRQIAKEMDVSKSLVSLIAAGLRDSVEESPQPAPRELREHQPSMARCGTCGALVSVPCVACRARAYVRRQRAWHASETARPRLVA